MSHVLDTSFVVDFLEGKAAAVSAFDLVQSTDGEVLLPSPALYEVLLSASRNVRESAREALAILVAQADIPTFGFAEASDTALLQNRLLMVGLP